MNYQTKEIATILGVSLEEAQIWEERIDDIEPIDWSEISQRALVKHIKEFKMTWENLYQFVTK